MNKRLFALTAALMLLPILSIAQFTTVNITADIPFAFHIGAEVLPDGTYNFAFKDQQMWVASKQTDARQMVKILTRISPRTENLLRFTQYSDALRGFAGLFECHYIV